jgi:hypothetical protein
MPAATSDNREQTSVGTLARVEPRHGANVGSVCFYVFALGGLAGLAQFGSPLPFGLGYEMVAIGKTLASGAGFANPFRILDTGPTAVNPPLYPLLLAMLFKVFRLPEFVLVAAAIGNIVMNALAGSWLPRVSLTLFGSMVPGVIAAILWLSVVELMPAWDVSYTSAGLILFCWYSASAARSPRPLKPTLCSGVIGGALILLNPSALFVIVPWLVYLVVRSGLTKRAVLFAAGVLIVSCVPAAAWMVRNVLVLGAPVLRTNLGMTLHVSNNDCAQATLLATARVGCYERHHPNDSFTEARALQVMGEVAYDRSRVESSLNWIASNSARFWQLTLERSREFWFPQSGNMGLRRYGIWLGTVLSIAGVLLMVWKREPAVGFVGCVLLVYPLMYYIVVSDVRYRYPILWLSFLAAGYVVAAGYDKWRRQAA